ncbi:helix-turn-helix domain-containing protein [Algirhabdus cladophorae]|uniref:helix-turn-helix domain-containing protein n=1 Tax=Algirhabdus cladophorae TaxID=3377108 RepID=UPI003B84A53B
MIGRKKTSAPSDDSAGKVKGFDQYTVSLGDVMRGERATLGKSLLDVQRELKIKATYISAIENADPTAFSSPGFIAGYVRSYARYLHLDPEWAFGAFCAESGFTTAHGMSAAASSPKPQRGPVAAAAGTRDLFENPNTPFVASGESIFSKIEAGALGSMTVLIALIAGLGYGGWTVLQEVQRVQFAPVDQTPNIVADIDPLAPQAPSSDIAGPQVTSSAVVPSSEALDRLYRPEALDVPVLVARDAPISTIDPSSVGTFATTPDSIVASALSEALEGTIVPQPQVNEGPIPEVVLFAVRPTWVRVRAADRSVLFEKILETGEEYVIPVTEETPVLRAGNSGSLYFKVNGQIVGPAGPGTSTVKNVALASTDLSAAYQPADPAKDEALFEVLKNLNAPAVLPGSNTQ